MKTFFVKAFVNEKNGEIVLNTLTRADARNLLSFLEECKDKPLSVELKDTSAGKTYEQLKTIYALSSIVYETMFFKRPTDTENHAFVHIPCCNRSRGAVRGLWEGGSEVRCTASVVASVHPHDRRYSLEKRRY